MYYNIIKGEHKLLNSLDDIKITFFYSELISISKERYIQSAHTNAVLNVFFAKGRQLKRDVLIYLLYRRTKYGRMS